MSKESIIEKIISDAESEAEEIIAQAKKKAEGIELSAQKKYEAAKLETERETKIKCDGIAERSTAAARLESSKILLAEKRKVIDAIYEEALNSLLNLNEEDSLHLIDGLLKKYAETGDEISFAENFAYEERVKLLPVIKKKKLTFSAERVKISGGILLKGKISDKDLSYKAILAVDREEHQSEIARAVFEG